MTDFSFISAEGITLLFNMLMVIAIGGLWMMWARGTRRQKQIETLLIATSEQLDEASRHLEEAMTHIQDVQAHENTRENHTVTHTSMAKPEIKIEPSSIKSPQNARPLKSSPVTSVLRMHREGYSAEDIAANQDIELAKVKLMLKLNERQAA